MRVRAERGLTGQSVTVGWQERMVTVVVVLNVSVSASQAPALRASAPRATKTIEARIVDGDDWASKRCFGRYEEDTTRLR